VRASSTDNDLPLSIGRCVYDDGERLGHCRQIDNLFAAFTRRGEELGRWPNLGAAAAAVIERARKGSQQDSRVVRRLR
jgi:hypothetical protein